MSFVDPRSRQSRTEKVFHESEVAAEPIAQFHRWFQEAVAADLPQPEAMTLATATADGRPSARMVLLRHCDERGFVFFTNYDSRKGSELEANPRAALVFFWEPLERQIRVEGRVERTSAAESDAYYTSRPRGSRLGAWASPQSQVIPGRETLDQEMRELEARFGDLEHVPRPVNWGGFRIVPDVVEFWQGQPSRLHDRLCYRRDGGSWKLVRLAP